MLTIEQQIIKHFNLNTRKLGMWQPIPCPFHRDSNPSAGILLTQKGSLVFNCLSGCGAKSAVTLANHLGFSGSSSSLASETDFFASQAATLDLAHSAGEIKRPLNNLRTHVLEVAKYFEDRHLDISLLDKFNGEYIRDQSSKLYGYLVFVYGRKKDHFLARRILDHQPELRPRFLNDKLNKEISLQEKASKLLFGGENVRYEKVVFLVEGITDFFTLYQMGYTNVVASLGAEPSEAMLIPLRNKTVFILYDTDYAGFKGAESASAILKRFGANPIVLDIPETFAKDDEDKVDVNSAYCKDSVIFTAWLQSQVSKYNTFDTDYVTGMTQGKIEATKYFSTGIKGFDRILNGGLATGVHCFAGPTGTGKSTLITHVTDVMRKQGARVLVVSYELPKPQCWARYASRYSSYTWQQIEADMKILEPQAVQELIRISQQVRVDCNWTVEEIKFAADNFDVVVVDYIQRMPSPRESKKDKVEENMEALSKLAVDKNKVVIVVSSINRQFGYGGDRPDLKSLKESGAIEFICQSVTFLSRFGNGGQITRLSILKNTRGEADKDVYIETDLANQGVKDTTFVPTELQQFVGQQQLVK